MYFDGEWIFVGLCFNCWLDVVMFECLFVNVVMVLWDM